ncbi:MAG TPA: hypothetical protein VGR26_12330 [Acidimicrobiales bacterium]|nr:hypothetical protein [Acidimicrobiales bacterium]
MTACTICNHPEVDQIDAALASNVPAPQVASRWDLHPSSVKRHKGKHLSAALVQAHQAAESDRALTLLDRIEELVNKVDRLVDTAEADGKPGLMLSGVKELRALLELLGKATGELKPDGAQITVNIATSEEWIRIRSALVAAIQPYPGAVEAVSTALAELEAP